MSAIRPCERASWFGSVEGPPPRRRLKPIRIEAAHRPLVAPELFQAARERMAGKRRRFTDEEIREGLSRLLRTHV